MTDIEKALKEGPTPETDGHARTAVTSRRFERRCAVLEEALEKIEKGPTKPFPDPGAHSWQAYAKAVMGAFTDNRFTAINVLAAIKKEHNDEAA